MDLTKKEEEYLDGLRGPEQWTEVEARRVLALVGSTGMSRAWFARRFGLTTARLAWWTRRLGKEAAVPERQAPAFVELVAAPKMEGTVACVRVGGVEVALRRLDHEAAAFVAELARLQEEASCS